MGSVILSAFLKTLFRGTKNMGYLVGFQKSYLTYIYRAKSSINGPFSIAFLKLPEGFFDEFYVDF